MKKILIANWKMNPGTLQEAENLLGSYKSDKKGNLIVCPPAPFLQPLRSKFGAKANFGAQDCAWRGNGPFTGSLSASSLKSCGADFVILGHSERRMYFGDTNEDIGRKAFAAISAHLAPIICLGGGAKSSDSEVTVKNLLKAQFLASTKAIKKMGRIILVFEPTFAISGGGGKILSAEKDAVMVDFLRKLAVGRLKGNVKNILFLYGGSVNRKNFRDLASQNTIDGFLVGSASLRPTEFNLLLNYLN